MDTSIFQCSTSLTRLNTCLILGIAQEAGVRLRSDLSVTTANTIGVPGVGKFKSRLINFVLASGCSLKYNNACARISLISLL